MKRLIIAAVFASISAFAATPAFARHCEDDCARREPAAARVEQPNPPERIRPERQTADQEAGSSIMNRVGRAAATGGSALGVGIGIIFTPTRTGCAQLPGQGC